MVTTQKDDFRKNAWAEDPDTWLTIPEFNVLPADVGWKGFDHHIYSLDIGSEIQNPMSNIIWYMRDIAKARFASLVDLYAAYDRVIDSGKRAEKGTEDEWYAYGYAIVFGNLRRWFLTQPFDPKNEMMHSNGSVYLVELALAILHMFSAGPHDPKSIQDLRSAFGRKGATTKLANSPKQQEKQLVKERWDVWQARPVLYKGKAEFARHMLAQYKTLESQRVIERWCLEWSRGDD